MCQCVYMNEASPYDYISDLAKQVQHLLREFLNASLAWAQRHLQFGTD